MYSAFEVEKQLKLNVFEEISSYYTWMHYHSILDSQTEDLKYFIKKIDEGLRFDLVIWDISTGQYLYPIIKKLGYPPFIATSPFGISFFINYEFGKFMNMFKPGSLMPYDEQMTFSQRVTNMILLSYGWYCAYYKLLPAETQVAKEIFGENIPSLDEIGRKISLVLTNSDNVLNYPEPLPPQIIQVGGLQVTRTEVLPQVGCLTF